MNPHPLGFRAPVWSWLLASLVACAPEPAPSAIAPLVHDELEPSHPRLLVRPGELDALRAKAAVSPWRDLALSALVFARDESFDPTAPDFVACLQMTDLCGALGLAYLLDPRPSRVAKLQQTLLGWQTLFLATPPPGDGVVVRWRQSAMLHSILALDVMHDGFAPADLAFFEGMLDSMVRQWWANLAQDGTQSTPGVVAVWALYQGDRNLATEASALYLERLLDNLTPSGVYSSGGGYSWVREAGERTAKSLPLDVLVHTRWNQRLYENPVLTGLHEWMYRGAFTPRLTNLTFGDSDPSRPIEALLGFSHPYRAGKFSLQAGKNAAWVVRDSVPRPLLANYALMDDTVLLPEPPASALWGDCATFWEAGAGVDSLMGALWNPRNRGGHSHRDVNAVHLYAYGENVLRNSGYCGQGVGVGAFDFDWIFDTAASSNTVTIDGAEHDEKVGDGIVEGLVAPRFDYAAGRAGASLDAGRHTRSLLQVHGEPGRPGYWVLLDEVDADAPGAVIDVSLHPDSDLVTPLALGREYEWRVQRLGTSEVRVNLFLATPPSFTELLDGGLCAFDGNAYVGKYLHARYPSDADGLANAVTLVVPHDATRPKPVLTRIPGGALFSGALVNFGGGVTDFVLESRTSQIAVGAAVCEGRALYGRSVAGAVTQYFVRRGRSFDDGVAQRTGFDSDAEVSVFVRDTAVHITSAAGATLVFFEPLLTGTVFTTPAGTVLDAGPGFVTIDLLPGAHAFDLATGATL